MCKEFPTTSIPEKGHITSQFHGLYEDMALTRAVRRGLPLCLALIFRSGFGGFVCVGAPLLREG